MDGNIDESETAILDELKIPEANGSLRTLLTAAIVHKENVADLKLSLRENVNKARNRFWEITGE